MQGKWIAAYLSGEMKLPDLDAKTAEIAQHREVQLKTYLDSKRYVLEVDSKSYSSQIRCDILAHKAGVK
jgi:hypothetical protein